LELVMVEMAEWEDDEGWWEEQALVSSGWTYALRRRAVGVGIGTVLWVRNVFVLIQGVGEAFEVV
jgi:hypothetical protein